MMKNKCSKCKIPIELGIFCTECYEIIKKDKITKLNNRNQSKLKNTELYGLSRVKEHVKDYSSWSSSHKNCFRAAIKLSKGGRSGETLDHVNKKFELWVHHRQLGRTVFTELQLKQGRPDLIVVDKGFVFIIEVVKSEKEASLIQKKAKYPFPIEIVRC